MDEEPRLLHRSLGYTDRVALALHGEPEAVPAEFQRQVTRRAALAADARLVAEWSQARDVMQGQLDWLRTRPVGQEFSSDLRVLQRQLERIDGRLRRAA